MAFKFSITQVKKVSLDGIFSRIDVIIACQNIDTEQVSHRYLSVNVDELSSLTKTNVLKFFKNKLTEIRPGITHTIAEDMKIEASQPIITEEIDDSLAGEIII